MLTFKKEQIDAILSHASELYPVECCGIIAGKDGDVSKTIKITNETGSPVEYSMDGLTVKKALDELDAAGLDLVGIYHSHPTSEARPSVVDIKKSLLPEIDYVIISLIDRDNPKIRNYKIIDNAAKEEPLKILS